MRILRAAGEDEVVTTFLRGELTSERFGKRLRALLAEDRRDETVLDDPGAAAYRRDLLGRHRGYGRDKGLFGGFPTAVSWQLAMFGREELLGIRYINWDWWLEVSDGSRSPVAAAERIRRGLVPGVDAATHEPWAREAAAAPPLIVATTPAREQFVVVEGHARLTAYALYPEHLPAELPVFLGESEAFVHWGEY